MAVIKSSDVSLFCELQTILWHLPELILHASVKQPIRQEHVPYFQSSSSNELWEVTFIITLQHRDVTFTNL